MLVGRPCSFYEKTNNQYANNTIQYRNIESYVYVVSRGVSPDVNKIE